MAEGDEHHLCRRRGAGQEASNLTDGDHRVESIAFPAISCGIYGFPIDEAADIAVREIRAALTAAMGPSSVLLVAFGEDVYSALCHATIS